MTEIEKGWLAGLIDGGGSMMLFRKRRKDVKEPNNIYVTAQLNITNSHKETLIKASNLIYEIIGRTPRWINDVHGNNQKKPCMRITIDIYSNIISLLEALKDILVTKKLQAELLLEFVKRASIKGKIRLHEREQFWRKMKFLNHSLGRGLSAETEREPPAMQDEATVRTSEKSDEVGRNVNSAELTCV